MACSGSELGGSTGDAVADELDASCSTKRRTTPPEVARQWGWIAQRSDSSVQILCSEGVGGPIATIFSFGSSQEATDAWKNRPKPHGWGHVCLVGSDLVEALVDGKDRSFCERIGGRPMSGAHHLG
jgi:hypothetical protein